MQFVPAQLEITIVIAPTGSLVMALVMGQDVNLLRNINFYWLQVFHNATYYLNNCIIPLMQYPGRFSRFIVI
jgi:hypothetical protein